MLGSAAVAIRVPPLPQLIGSEVFAQWAIFDLGANLLGVISSDACHVTIGG